MLSVYNTILSYVMNSIKSFKRTKTKTDIDPSVFSSTCLVEATTYM